MRERERERERENQRETEAERESEIWQITRILVLEERRKQTETITKATELSTHKFFLIIALRFHADIFNMSRVSEKLHISDSSIRKVI